MWWVGNLWVRLQVPSTTAGVQGETLRETSCVWVGEFLSHEWAAERVNKSSRVTQVKTFKTFYVKLPKRPKLPETVKQRLCACLQWAHQAAGVWISPRGVAIRIELLNLPDATWCNSQSCPLCIVLQQSIWINTPWYALFSKQILLLERLSEDPRSYEQSELWNTTRLDGSTNGGKPKKAESKAGRAESISYTVALLSMLSELRHQEVIRATNSLCPAKDAVLGRSSAVHQDIGAVKRVQRHR